MRLYLLFIIFLFASSQLAFARGGTEVGNGSDHLSPFHQAAWFLGEERTVKACIESSANFPVSPGEAALAIESAYGRWISYVHAKGVYEAGFLFEAEEGDARSAMLRFAEKISVGLKCAGGEDLTIYLGKANPAVDKIKSQFMNPLAFAHREKFEASAGWSRGLIWVGADAFAEGGPEIPFALEATFIHELGHIFGIGHVPETIMAESFAENLAKSLQSLQTAQSWRLREDSFRSLLKIDTHRELFACLNCNEEFQQVIDARNRGLFAEIAGRPVAAGSASCHLIFRDRFQSDFSLNCSDAGNQPLWKIVPIADRIPLLNGEEIFKRRQIRGGAILSQSVPGLNGDITYAKLTNQVGKAFTVLIERNLNGNASSIAVKLMRDGKADYLLDSNDVMQRRNAR